MFPTLRHLLMATLFSLLAVVSYTDKVPSTNDWETRHCYYSFPSEYPNEAPTNTDAFGNNPNNPNTYLNCYTHDY